MTESDALQSAIETADDLEADLEAIASSDLPFAEDAQKILNKLHKEREE